MDLSFRSSPFADQNLFLSACLLLSVVTCSAAEASGIRTRDSAPTTMETSEVKASPLDNPFIESTQLEEYVQESSAESTNDLEESVKRCNGYRYGRMGFPQDYDKAFPWCMEAAQGGHPVGQSILGALYYNGFGVEQSHRDALFWFTLAANRRMAHAAYSLYFMYFTGLGTEVDYETAFMYLHRAAELGNEQARNVFSNTEDNPPPATKLSEQDIKDEIEARGYWKVSPMYPKAAQYAGLEGYVIVEYCIDKDGRTTNIHITDSVPKGVFDNAAIGAAKQFRYKPTVVDGVIQERHGVANKFTFNLEKP